MSSLLQSRIPDKPELELLKMSLLKDGIQFRLMELFSLPMDSLDLNILCSILIAIHHFWTFLCITYLLLSLPRLSMILIQMLGLDGGKGSFRSYLMSKRQWLSISGLLTVKYAHLLGDHTPVFTLVQEWIAIINGNANRLFDPKVLLVCEIT